MTAPVLQERRVLIVEDQYLIADEMRRAVAALGGVVVGPSPSVAAARRRLDEERVDLALLDINLGGEDVFPLTDELVASGVPVIFATGYDDEMIPDRYQGCGRIQKPVSKGALEAAARSMGL